MSDTVPLFGYRRRSYLALCGLLGAGSWLALALSVHSVEGAVAALFLGSISTACSDVVVDSIVVERCRDRPQSTAGSLQSLCWTFQSLGGIASAYFSGWAVELYGTRPVFAATAVFPLLVSVAALCIVEQRVGGAQEPAENNTLLPDAPVRGEQYWVSSLVVVSFHRVFSSSLVVMSFHQVFSSYIFVESCGGMRTISPYAPPWTGIAAASASASPGWCAVGHCATTRHFPSRLVCVFMAGTSHRTHTMMVTWRHTTYVCIHCRQRRKQTLPCFISTRSSCIFRQNFSAGSHWPAR